MLCASQAQWHASISKLAPLLQALLCEYKEGTCIECVVISLLQHRSWAAQILGTCLACSSLPVAKSLMLMVPDDC